MATTNAIRANMLMPKTQPKSPTWTRNPIAWQFQSSHADGSLFAGEGVFAEICFNSSFFQNNDTIEISWTDGVKTQNITLTAKPFPALPTDFLAHPALGTATLFDYVEELHSSLINFSQLTASFDIALQSSPLCIQFRAKEVSADWSITLDAFTSADVSTTIDNDIIEDSTPEHYKVCVEVYFQADYPAGNFQKVATLEDTPNQYGLTSFDLQYILDAETKCSIASPPIPKPVEGNSPIIADNIRQYYLVFFEKFGTPQKSQGCYYMQPEKLLCGGVHTKLFEEDYLPCYLQQSTSLLSWQPKKREVHIDQLHWLHWYNYTGATVTPGLLINFYDANSNTPILSGTFQVAPETDAAHTVTFPIGLQHLGFLNSNVVKYTVQVVDSSSGNALSEICVFSVICEHSECKKNRYYLNAFCLAESIVLTGQEATKLDINRQFSLTGDRSGNYLQQWCFDFTNAYICRTGYHTKAQIEALQEMLIYGELYEIDENGQCCAYLINTKKFDITECLQFLHALQFEAVPALQSINYSKI